MCGICGVFEYRTGGAVSREQLQSMNDTLRHRGPDDEGFYCKHGIGLAMRRLSIIDVAGGQQPIANEDETAWIVFNGEIYNYQALQKRMLELGHRLRTRSDTEIVLHLYEEYGAECVQYLDGMFAFAIYDGRSSAGNGRLFIARDRLGKKPLYYADVDGALIFGSEIKPLLLDRRVSKELDFEALYHYLSLLVVPAPWSIFKSIRKLPQGHTLECDGNGLRLSNYWNYLDHAADRRIPAEEAAAEIRRLLFAAVGKRLIAEVPLGAFLSGGLDSSVVVAIMSRLKSEPVKTFSVGFEGPATHNELPHARALAEYYRTDHHETFARPSIVELLPQLVRHTDEPFAISSAIPTFIIAQEARRHVTVVLTGDGGDEVFGGYGHYLFERWAALYRRLPTAIDSLLTTTTGLSRGPITRWDGRLHSRIARFTANARREVSKRRLGWASAFSESEKIDLLPAFHGAQSTPAFLSTRLNGVANAAPGAQQNYLDMLVWLPDEMLTKVDRMTMAASVEGRCPMLDWKLVEYMAGISLDEKIPGWTQASLKHLLRRAVGDLLPPNLLNRPKQGFNVPLDYWFRGEASSYLESKLNPDRIKRRGVFSSDAVSRLMARHQAGAANLSNRLYALLVFEVWADVMMV